VNFAKFLRLPPFPQLDSDVPLGYSDLGSIPPYSGFPKNFGLSSTLIMKSWPLFPALNFFMSYSGPSKTSFGAPGDFFLKSGTPLLVVPFTEQPPPLKLNEWHFLNPFLLGASTTRFPGRFSSLESAVPFEAATKSFLFSSDRTFFFFSFFLLRRVTGNSAHLNPPFSSFLPLDGIKTTLFAFSKVQARSSYLTPSKGKTNIGFL